MTPSLSPVRDDVLRQLVALEPVAERLARAILDGCRPNEAMLLDAEQIIDLIEDKRAMLGGTL